MREIFGIELPNKFYIYQNSYPSYFDSVAYPISLHIPDFVKFNGEDSMTTWEHVSQWGWLG
jgi:hypothetical protein